MRWWADPFANNIEHLDGVAWTDAPRPSRWHRCQAQTRGWHVATYVQRCACGAIKIDRGRWRNRNSRKKDSR